MVWLTAREPLINVVRTNKPKTLTGLSQKARGQVQGSRIPSRRWRATGGQAEPTPSMVLVRNVVSPYPPVRESEP